MRNRRLIWVFALVAILIALAAVLPAVAAERDEVSVIRRVRIVDFAFSPRRVMAISGADRIGWSNVGNAPHTATSTTGLFDSGTLDPGERFLWTPPGPGTYDYFCEIHPDMTGRILVS
jgi:plastocyanin